MCPGAAGYRLLVAGSDSSPKLTVIAPDGSRHPLQYWDVNAPEFASLANSISWGMARRGRRVTPIAITLTVNVKYDRYSRNQDPYTVVAKWTRAKVCIVGRLRPSGTFAAEVHATLQSAPYRKCLALDDTGEKDWLGLVFGLVSEGRYEDAKSVVKQMPTNQRGIAYASIAQEQEKSGDVSGARRTLQIGLDDASRVTDEAERKRMTVSVIEGMAATGLYDEVKLAIKRLKPSDVTSMLLMIGKIQGDSYPAGRGDTETARETFKEAIEIELSRQDTVTADNHLAEIADGQLQVGLVKEAKHTASLIKNASTRQLVEDTISRRTAKPD